MLRAVTSSLGPEHDVGAGGERGNPPPGGARRRSPGDQIRCPDGRATALVPVAAGPAALLGHPGRAGRHLRVRGLGALARAPSTGSPARSSAPAPGIWSAPSRCVARSNWCGSPSRSPRRICRRWPSTRRRRSRCATHCSGTAARWRSPLRRSTRPRPKPAARGMRRVEAAVVDGIVRGEDFGSLSSRAAALDWDPPPTPWWSPGWHRPATGRTQWRRSRSGRRRSAGRRCPACTATDWCWFWRVTLHLDRRSRPCSGMGRWCGDGRCAGLREAVVSAADALAGLDVAAAWPGAPRTIDADDLLAERVLGGDHRAAAARAPTRRLRTAGRGTLSVADHDGGLPGHRRRARTHRPRTCSCTPIPFATGCTGSPI